MFDRSNNTEIQVILHKIQQGGVHYVESVSQSFETAKLGYAFAKRAKDLCNNLGRPECFDGLIHDSITEMQAIAEKAHADAKATAAMFSANRQEFTQVRRGYTDQSCSNTIFVDPNQHLRDS
jgi:hypothetical protein